MMCCPFPFFLFVVVVVCLFVCCFFALFLFLFIYCFVLLLLSLSCLDFLLGSVYLEHTLIYTNVFSNISIKLSVISLFT